MNKFLSEHARICFVSLFLLVWPGLTKVVLGQGFRPESGNSNPFNTVNTGSGGTSTSLADLDGDGDLDMIVTKFDGGIQYYINTGVIPPSTQPVFVLSEGVPIPQPNVGSNKNLKFAFGDLDGDGDLDAITGNRDGLILPFFNNGTRTNPIYAQGIIPRGSNRGRAAAGPNNQNIVPGIDYTNEGYTYVSLADFDADGDLDMLVITNTAIHYLRNVGSPSAASFQEVTGCDNPFSAIRRTSVVSNPIIGDLDGDEDLDVAFSGLPITYYRNIGTPQNPVFIQIVGEGNPFDGINIDPSAQIELGDLDQDGDNDIVVGLPSGEIDYLRNAVRIAQQPQPASVAVCAGASVSTIVSVFRDGEGQPQYQWFRNTQSSDTPVEGQNTPTLTLTNLQPDDAGLYFLRVTDGENVVLFSDGFNVVVQQAIITEQPASGSTVAAGTNVVVPVSVNGPNPTFQWYRNGNAVEGQTDATLTLNQVTPAQSGSYVLVVTSTCNSLTSTAFDLTVQPASASVSATKTVAGNFTPGGGITYTIVIDPGSHFQYDNSGDEFTDVLPTSLSLVSATATTGNAVANLSTNSVTWNGFFSPGTLITIRIEATIKNGTGGQTISNQGRVNYDADNNQSNETTVLTDDPDAEGTSNPTIFQVFCPPLSVSLTNDGPLTCAKPVVLLTATATEMVPLSVRPGSARAGAANAPAATTYTYVFSPGVTQVDGVSSNTATVNTGGIYSVTVTASTGCTATAQTEVINNSELAAPTLQASAQNTTNQPISVTASGCTSGTLNWSAQGGTGTANGAVYTFTQPGNYTLTATCTQNSCTSPASAPVVLSILPAASGFSITSVTMVTCQLVDAAKGGYQVSFTPQYAGQNSNPISFSIVNEKLLTTDPPPYSIRLYTDNPIITLVANQAGNPEARFQYNWWASCQLGSSPNQPPRTTGIASRTIVQGQAFQLELKNYFADPEQQPLTFSADGLPAGITLAGSVISGSTSTTGVSTVTVTAFDPGGLSVNTSFQLVVNPVSTTPGAFTITGVTTIRCETLNANNRRLSFNPQYAGVTGQPISFSIVNERLPTTDPGPYTIDLNIDNPVIRLSAKQGTITAGFVYNWLAACNAPARVGVPETGQELEVKVLGNPVDGKDAEIEITGASGENVQIELIDQQGRVLGKQQINKAGQVERASIPVHSGKGTLLLQVSTSTQRQLVKLLKP